MRSTRAFLQLGSAVAALLAAPALGQETTPDDAQPQSQTTEAQSENNVAAEEGAATERNVGDIVVTARRREESLLDVPIAVSAFTGAQLEAQGFLDITDITNVTPSVTLEVSRGTNNTLTAFIRGVGQQDPVAGFEAGVGIYLDDVYLNRPQAAVLDIYDVERIEVLRGPQGTLYGRNTIGGAVKYVTRRLGDEPTARVRATYGSYDQADLVVGASAPIGDGTVKVGVAGARLSRGGFGENLTTGRENYNRDIWAARGTLQVEPSDEFFLRLSADYTKDDSEPRGGHRLIPDLAAPFQFPLLDDVFDSRGGLLDPEQEVEAYGGSLFMEARPADWLTVRSITGYRKDDSATPIDFDALPAVDVDVPAFYNNEQFSQELQALVDIGGFNGLLGFYYLDARARTVFDVRLPATLTALTSGNVKTDTYAVFGDFTYDVTPQLSLSVGGRYTWDTRTSQVVRNVYLGPSPAFGGTSNPIVRQTDFRGSADFSEFTPRASVSFKPTPDHTLYASYAQGFKGGGFDPRGVGTAAPDLNGNGRNGNQGDQADIYEFLSFDPERVDSYEIGYKASLLDRRVNLAVAAFHSDYTDVQVPGSIGQTVNGVQTFVGITTNAGKARIRGVEAEVNATIFDDLTGNGDRLTFVGSFSYLDAKYLRFIDARGIDVADSRRIQNTPKYTFSETLGYSLPVGEGSIDASATLSYRSFVQQFELRTPGLDQPAFGLLDANLVWNIDDNFSLGVHGRNLLDKEYIVAGYNFLAQNPDTGAYVLSATPRLANGRPNPLFLVPGRASTLGNEGVLTAYYGNPRQVFATLSAKF